MSGAALDHDAARRRGAAYALASALVFGAGAPAAKVLLESIDPWLMAGFLYVGAGVGLSVLRLGRQAVTKRVVAEARLTGQGWRWFIGAAIAGGIIAPALLMNGLDRTPASTGSLFLNLEAVLTVLIAWAVFREQIGRHVVIGIVAVIAGGVALAWSTEGGFAGAIGPLLIAGACLAWAFDNNFTQKISLSDPFQIGALRGLIAGPINVGLALAAGASLPTWYHALAAAGLGLLSYGLALAFFVFGLRDLGTARTGAFFATAPFIGAIISVTALGEPLTIRLGVAGALMAIGVWFIVRDNHEHEHEHEPLTHNHRHRHDLHHRHEHGPDDPPGEPHSHAHAHAHMRHRHPHAPDEHHRHRH